MGKRAKKRAYRRHARSRFRSRLDIDLTDAMAQGLVADIRDGSLNLYYKSSDKRRAYHAIIGGKPCIVIYDKQLKSIITAWEHKTTEPKGENT